MPHIGILLPKREMETGIFYQSDILKSLNRLFSFGGKGFTEEVKVRVSLDWWSAMVLNYKLKKIRRNIDAATASIKKCEAKIESARSALAELADSELVVNVD